MHITGSRPDFRKKKENVPASASHDGGPASIYHPSGSIDILKPPIGLASRAARGFVRLPGMESQDLNPGNFARCCHSSTGDPTDINGGLGLAYRIQCSHNII